LAHLCKVKPVFLIGYMGSGKSSLGPKLARKLDVPFFDLDQEIERSFGLSIADVFRNHGEHAFRKKERELLHVFSTREDCFVLSTGGGTPCYFDNMEVLAKSGIVVYLHLSPAALASRLRHGKDQRPVIAGVAPEDLTDFIAAQLSKREAYYNRAHIKVSGLSLRMEMLLKRLEEVNKKYFGSSLGKG
jgi:shikimate kinase